MIQRPILAALVSLLIATVAVAGASATDTGRHWPQWRGPLGTGVAPNGDPPAEWSETLNVRWKVRIPGKGVSSPIVWGEQVFVTTAIETDKQVDPAAVEAAERDLPEWRRQRGVSPSHVLQYAVLSLDRRTGRILWRRTLREAAPHEGTHRDGSWASGSPVTDGEHLIVSFGSNGLFGLDLQGNLLWDRDLGNMTTRRGFGEGSSPALYRDTLVVNWDHEGPSFIIALDKRTGHTRWKAERDEMTSWSTPIVVNHDGKPQVVVSATNRTRGYDLATGELLWEAAGMTTNTIPSPVSADGRVFVTSGFRGNALQAIDLSRAAGDITDTPAIAWQYDQDTPYVPSPLLYDGQIYIIKHIKGILSCFDARTGRALYGPQRLEGIEGVFASPVAAGGRIYVAGRNGVTLVVKHGSEFEVLARNALEDDFEASPAIADDALYLRGHEHLYCIAP